MSYAEAFKKIFDDIFDALPRAKPRIRKSGSGWVCEGQGFKGYGVNCRQAFGAWQAVKGQP